MKQFEKVLILKWHYIEHECIQLGDINFLTGKNASGKSTLIDALQLVLLGDTKGNFFNKAANERSLRSLDSYVRGELSDSETGYDYLRNGDFSSMIAIEVKDTIKKKTFVIGIHMDVYHDGSLNHRYFVMDDRIPEHHFIQQDVVMNISELKAWCQSENINCEQFPSNKRYREVLLARLGHINQKFFSLFKKAVPFSPITDIKGFITEFICDTDKKIEIKDMQDNIRYYEKMKLEAEDIERRLSYLEQIDQAYEEYSQLCLTEQIHQYVLDKGREQVAVEEVERLSNDLKQSQQQLEKTESAIQIGQDKIKRLGHQIEDLARELAKSDAATLKQKMEREIEELSQKIDRIKAEKQNIFSRLRLRAGKWTYFGGAVLDGVELLTELEAVFGQQQVETIDLEELTRLNRQLEDKLSDWRQQLYHHKQQLTEMEQQRAVLDNEIENLKQGKKAIPAGVQKLQRILEAEFGQVSMLCDRIEIKHPKWQNAIEGYLHLQKFHLLVAPEKFEAALKRYEEVKAEEKIYDVGLVDLQKVEANHRRPKLGSLAEEVIADQPQIQCYVDYLLGAVIKVEQVADLRKHKTSITPTGMLYKNFVARKLNPNRYEIPFIGKAAVSKQLQLKEEQAARQAERYQLQTKEKEFYEKACSLPSLGEDTLEQLADRIQDMRMLSSLEEQYRVLQRQKSEIDMTNVMALEERRGALEQEKQVQTDELIERKANKMRLAERCQRLETDTIPRAQRTRQQCQEQLEQRFSVEFIAQTGRPKYEEAIERLKKAGEVVQNYESVVKRSESLKQKKWAQVIEVRMNYTREFRATYDFQAQTNDQYDKLRRQLAETELPAYKQKIEDAIKIAQQEFRDDFLSKLKYNIDVVKEQISELNEALKNMSFGKDTYAFKVTPNAYYKKYYDMITDPNLMADFNLFSFSFQEKHGAVIEELFKKIVDVGEGAISADERAEIEANIAKYTDYRTYLDFDLVVTDLRGNKSHLSKMISKKSGGETQTPFYISVLASFYRVYRMNTKARDTARLIIFDEAFSKMDHERIEQCIRLLKELGFQALISAPTEKIANITPLVDKTLCVLRNEETTAIKGFTKQELLAE